MTPRRSTTGKLRRKRNRRVTQKAPRQWTFALPRGIGRGVLGLLLLSGAALVVGYGWESLSESRRLRVSAVEVLGSQRARWEELQAYTRLQVGDAILGLNLDNVATGLRRHPWVKSATVRRRLPNRVTIHIEEHEPGLLVALEEIYIANKEGVLFKRLSPLDQVVLPVLTGLTKEDPVMRPSETQGVIQEAMALAAACTTKDVAAGFGSLEELRWDGTLGWSITVRPPSGTLVIHLGVDPVARIDRALAGLDRLRRMGRTPVELWADGDQRNTRVQARLAAFATSGDASTSDQPTLFAKAGD